MPTFMENVATNWKGFKKFAWNIEEGEVFGRTGISWLQIISFLFVFYTFIGGFFALYLWLRLRYLPDLSSGPYRHDYLTHDGPGLRVIPMGEREQLYIDYNPNQQSTYQYYVDGITTFLSDYVTVNNTDMSFLFRQCTEDVPQGRCGVINEADRDFTYFESVPIPNTGVKAYNLFNLGDCLSDYGFQQAEPCFFFTINKVFGWMPSSVRPKSRKDLKYVGEINDLDSKFVPLFCQGLRQKDRDHIDQIEIYPSKGFSMEYFPWRRQEFYRPPVVAVQVKVLPSGYNRDIRVECVILADNIFHSKRFPNVGRRELKIRVSN